MNKPTLLARLAMAGIASGMLALTQCSKSEKAGDGDGAGAKDASAETPAVETGSMPDSSMDKARMDTMKTAENACKGINACKGQGGCAVSDADLKVFAAKAGIPLEKAGKAHGCKGQNDCKGLGGCKM